MASGNSAVRSDPALEQQWADARRTDLGDAFGLILSPPWHGPDEGGRIVYGRRPPHGMADERIVSSFREEMRALLVNEAQRLVPQGLLTDESIASIDGRQYDIGPAAQSWPCLLYNFYLDARPFINDGASLLAWGTFFYQIRRRMREWILTNNPPALRQVPDDGSPIFTRPAIVTLCYADLTKRYDVPNEVELEAHARSWTEYSTPDHPGGSESYLVRATVGDYQYFYSVGANGSLNDHYMVVGKRLSLLPLPDELGGDSMTMREPQPVQRLVVVK